MSGIREEKTGDGGEKKKKEREKFVAKVSAAVELRWRVVTRGIIGASIY